MTRPSLVALALAATFLAAGSADAGPRGKRYRTKQCSGTAQKNIHDAVDFVNDHMEHLKNAPNVNYGKRRGQRRRTRRRMDRKISKVRWVCSSRRKCAVGNSTNGHNMTGIFGRKVTLCYDNMVIHKRFDFCHLVRTAAHEFGHSVGIRKAHGGDHSRYHNDSVYQLGYHAEKLCRDAGLARALEL